jgi:hypothetical protein
LDKDVEDVGQVRGVFATTLAEGTALVLDEVLDNLGTGVEIGTVIGEETGETHTFIGEVGRESTLRSITSISVIGRVSTSRAGGSVTVSDTVALSEGVVVDGDTIEELIGGAGQSSGES